MTRLMTRNVTYSETMRKYLGDSPVNVQLYAKLKRNLSVNSERITDLDFLQFAKNSEFFKNNYPYEDYLQYFRSTERPENIGGGVNAYAPAVKSVDAVYQQLKKCAWDNKPKISCPDLWKNTLVFLEYEFGWVLDGSRILKADDILEKKMDLSKSPGPLWKGKYPTKKDMYFNLEGQHALSQYWEELSRDGGGMILYGGNLKDELRDLERVRKSKTRLFYAASMPHAYAGFRLFGDQNERLLKSVGQTVSTIGETRYYGGFDRMLKPFEKRRVFDADGVGFDSKFFMDAEWDLCEFRWNHIHHEDQTIDNFLRCFNWYNNIIVKFVLLPDGTIWTVLGGMPSGVMTTVQDNTFHHFRQHIYTWFKKIDASLSKENFFRFKNFYYLRIIGDDCLVGIHPKLEITQKDILSCLNEFLDHEIIHSDFCDVRESTYCSQTVAEVSGHFYPIANRSKMLGSLIQGRKRGTKANTLCRAAGVRQHCYYDKPLFDFVSEFCRFWIQKYGNLIGFDRKSITGSLLSDSEIHHIYTVPYESGFACKTKTTLKRERYEYSESS